MKDEENKDRKVYAFVMTLSHSRYRYVEFVNSQNQKTWLQLHINAFNFFGGVPSRILIDNLKSGVIKANIYDPTLNESYSELSRFFGFVIDPAKSYQPQQKGKVERSIRIVKEQLIAGRKYSSIAEANKEARIWVLSHLLIINRKSPIFADFSIFFKRLKNKIFDKRFVGFQNTRVDFS